MFLPARISISADLVEYERVKWVRVLLEPLPNGLLVASSQLSYIHSV
jgi:hypothetical protein